jgi:hypothetical protein
VFVTECHYTNGDVGHTTTSMCEPCGRHFAKHEPSHIVIRPDTAEGQNVSDLLHKAADMRSALNRLIHTINPIGGVVKFKSGAVAPAADEEWLDMGDAYICACEALGLTPVIGG